MKPIQFEQANSMFVAPGCGNLPIANVSPTPNGPMILISCWELTEEDLDRILVTKKIWFQCVGIQPPIAVNTEFPFAEPATDDEFPQDIDVPDPE